MQVNSHQKINLKKRNLNVGVVTLSEISASVRLRQDNLHESEDSLGYIPNTRLAQLIKGDPVSKKSH